MVTLVIFNIITIAVIVVSLIICKKYIKSERTKYILLLSAGLLTIACHYSSLLYHQIVDGSAMVYLKDNPNLILPIYPCNVVMWSCLIFGICKNKNSKFCKFLIDYIFWFGIFSTLVGMFANVDFIRNPTLADYDITKGILAHATLLFNVLLMPVFGYTKIDLNKNIVHIFIAILVMLVAGLYCNTVFEVLVSKESANHVNSMFLIHSPFDGLDFLTYPNIALISLLLYFIAFHICELIAYKKGKRWYNRIKKYRNNNINRSASNNAEPSQNQTTDN